MRGLVSSFDKTVLNFNNFTLSYFVADYLMEMYTNVKKKKVVWSIGGKKWEAGVTRLKPTAAMARIKLRYSHAWQ